MDELFKNKKVVQVVIIFLFSVSAYFIGMVMNNIKTNAFIGRDIPALTTISVSGTGEAFAKPDVAEISFSISEDAKTVAEAQKTSTEKINKIMAYLKDTMKIADKDIKTTDYSVYPKYEYQKAVSPSPVSSMMQYYPEGKQVLVGYTVSQSVTVKVRNIDNAGTILANLGEKGATNMSGLNFIVDAKKEFEAQARDLAVKEAQAKAEAMAKSLGVKLTRITSFSESGNTPVYNYGMGGDMRKTSMMAEAVPAPAPTIATGENKFTSNVTITYEIQ